MRLTKVGEDGPGDAPNSVYGPREPWQEATSLLVNNWKENSVRLQLPVFSAHQSLLQCIIAQAQIEKHVIYGVNVTYKWSRRSIVNIEDKRTCVSWTSWMIRRPKDIKKRKECVSPLPKGIGRTRSWHRWWGRRGRRRRMIVFVAVAVDVVVGVGVGIVDSQSAQRLVWTWASGCVSKLRLHCSLIDIKSR